MDKKLITVIKVFGMAASVVGMIASGFADSKKNQLVQQQEAEKFFANLAKDKGGQ